MHLDNLIVREEIIAKLKRRRTAAKLMIKHNFVTAYNKQSEITDLDVMIDWLKRGGQYTIPKPGFLSTYHGTVII